MISQEDSRLAVQNPESVCLKFQRNWGAWGGREMFCWGWEWFQFGFFCLGGGVVCCCYGFFKYTEIITNRASLWT